MWIAADRLETMQQGSRILLDWMEDLLRTGLASLAAQGGSYLETVASSMVDWKLPGIARALRTWPIILQEAGWEESIALDLGRFRLLCAALQQFEELDEVTQMDALQYAGLSIRKDQLQDAEVMAGRWVVLGLDSGLSQGLQWRRTWLIGESLRPGYVDEYVWGEEAYFEYNWKVGETAEATLKCFPGSYPPRLFVQEFSRSEWQVPDGAGYDDIASLGMEYATALSNNPWLLEFPALLHHQRLYYCKQENRWMLRDQNDLLMPTNLKDSQALKLSDHKIYTVFGVWNGRVWKGLSYIADGIRAF